jgi:hypothetical protein
MDDFRWRCLSLGTCDQPLGAGIVTTICRYVAMLSFLHKCWFSNVFKCCTVRDVIAENVESNTEIFWAVCKQIENVFRLFGLRQ